MINKINNNSNKTTFGMSCKKTLSVKKIPGAWEEIKANKKALKEISDEYFTIFTSDYTKELACYTFNKSKFGLVNNFFETCPNAKIVLTEIKKQLFGIITHGESSNYKQVKMPAIELAKESKADLIATNLGNTNKINKKKNNQIQILPQS